MRRLLPVASAALALALLSPASAGAPENRWLVYVAGELHEEAGTLMAVRSNGAGHRRLADSVAEADLGPQRTAYAIVHGDGGDTLGRLSLTGGEIETLPGGPEGGRLFGIAASAEDDLAFQRFVDVGADAPRHLAEALPSLARTRLRVLAPPRRPPGTTATVAGSSPRSYELTFTNDPEGALSHAEQVIVFISASTRPAEPPPEATEVAVRGTTGTFSCGASACFLDWEEDGTGYAIGEFGSTDQAVGFAESLVPMEELAGPAWRSPIDFQAPQLVVLRDEGELVLESVEDFCECSFRPVDWNGAADRLLVTTAAEGFTTLMEYPTGGEPVTLEEGTGPDGSILDAAYGPDGPLVLVAPDFGPAGIVRPVGGGEAIVEGAVSFDVEGSTLAWVDGDGTVRVRDLESGDEREVAQGARSVSLSPTATRRRPPPSPPVFPGGPDAEGFPILLVAALVAATVALGAGTYLVIRARRGR